MLACVLAVCLWADNVGAQPAAADKESARTAYRLGTALAKQGQWKEALGSFSRSAALFPHPATTFNVAYCERGLGHATRARKFFRLALEQHEATGDLSLARVAQAKGYLAEIESTLAHVQVTVTPGARVTADGTALRGRSPTFVAGVATEHVGTRIGDPSFELIIDPGAHTLLAEGPRGERVELTITVEPGARESVSLVFAADPLPSPTRMRWSIVVMGTGAAGLVAGTMFGIAAFDKRAVLTEHCPQPSRCPVEHEGDIATLRRASQASTIAFTAGGVVSAVGLALFIYDRVVNGEPQGDTVGFTPSGLVVVF